MFVDRSIDPTADQVRALRDVPDERPITMVNLLKFRAQARYDDPGEAPCSRYAGLERTVLLRCAVE